MFLINLFLKKVGPQKPERRNIMTEQTRIVLVLALIAALSGVANASQLYANETGWWHEGGAFTPDSTPIQSAVNGAESGDSIYVHGGSYTENVNVDRTLTLEGVGADAVTVAAESAGYSVFEVTAERVNISGFTLTGADHRHGIYINHADHCNISENNASENRHGIYLRYSSNNTLTANICPDNEYGICIDRSSNNTLRENTMSGSRYNFVVDGNAISHHIQNIGTSNTVNEKPIYYWVDQQDRAIPDDAGFVGVVNSTNITVRDLVLTENWQGVLLAYTEDSRIENVTTRDNMHGIWLYGSSDNTLRANNVSDNGGYGIGLHWSSDNALWENTMSRNRYNFVVFYGYAQNIDTSNTVDGKPIYYWVGQQDRVIPDDAGFVGVVDSTNITVRDLVLTKNFCGVLFADTDNSRIENVTASDNERGIYLTYSTNNTLTANNVLKNYYGICMGSSSDNTLCDNNASENERGIYLGSSSDNTLTANICSDNNQNGIALERSSGNNITCNLVRNNRRGLYTYHGSTENTISHNNIIENGDYNETSGGWEWQLYNDQPDDVDASDNWWGTGDKASIAAGIKGNVTCLPCLDAPAPCAPSTDAEPGGFTTADALIALEIAAGSRPNDPRRDVSRDGRITALDGLMILHAAAGNIELQGCELK